MLFQVEGQGTRPTFFEMAAAQKLPASLRAALTYSIGVLALRRPILHKVVLPYLKSKLHSIYNKEREARLQASLWGPGDERFENVDYYVEGEASIASRTSTEAETTIRTRLAKNIQKIIGLCYPWIHATTEGLAFTYQLLYLLDATGFYSVGLHALGIHVCRATGQELAVQGALLKCAYVVLDYAQTGLIAAVFIFKVNSHELTWKFGALHHHLHFFLFSILMETEDVNTSQLPSKF
ncbi:Peroxisome bioproteinsis protein 12 [Hibiscus syriacus]|uniref:Peroxisome bioproteinsis protein 12 n=1 Tax=Hibiscus syriacus TaxID=106335 RepID=A0A6A3C1E3_HIBSY|nr:Peroxisome bioproteinsis protein 12 [Hibiscus syriacus]